MWKLPLSLLLPPPAGARVKRGNASRRKSKARTSMVGGVVGGRQEAKVESRVDFVLKRSRKGEEVRRKRTVAGDTCWLM